MTTIRTSTIGTSLAQSSHLRITTHRIVNLGRQQLVRLSRREVNHRAANVTDDDDDDIDEVMRDEQPQGYTFNYDAHNRDAPFDSYDPYIPDPSVGIIAKYEGSQ
jgi:hypothetical protein